MVVQFKYLRGKLNLIGQCAFSICNADAIDFSEQLAEEFFIGITTAEIVYHDVEHRKAWQQIIESFGRNNPRRL